MKKITLKMTSEIIKAKSHNFSNWILKYQPDKIQITLNLSIAISMIDEGSISWYSSSYKSIKNWRKQYEKQVTKEWWIVNEHIEKYLIF